MSNGGSITRKFQVMNLTQVECAYNINSNDNYIHSCFILSRNKGRIKANAKEEIEITYKPYINSSIDNQTFNIQSISGNGTSFNISGKSEALRITCSSNQL